MSIKQTLKEFDEAPILHMSGSVTFVKKEDVKQFLIKDRISYIEGLIDRFARIIMKAPWDKPDTEGKMEVLKVAIATLRDDLKEAQEALKADKISK